MTHAKTRWSRLFLSDYASGKLHCRSANGRLKPIKKAQQLVASKAIHTRGFKKHMLLLATDASDSSWQKALKCPKTTGCF
jgi:hypothetical protein